MKSNKPNVLLLKPEPAYNCFSLEKALSTEPLELEYISAMLKNEQYPFYIWEAAIEGPEGFDHILRQFHPDYRIYHTGIPYASICPKGKNS